MDIVPMGAGRPSPVIAVHAPRHATDKAAATSLNTPVFLAPKRSARSSRAKQLNYRWHTAHNRRIGN